MCILQGINTFERGNTLASIRKRGNSYLFRVYAGYDTDGKQIEKTKTWKPPADWTERRAEKEAQRLAALFEEQVRTGGLSNGKMKFADFAAYWMQKYAEPNLKPKTVTRYNGLLRRINRSIGYLPLNKIQPGNLLEFYQSLGDETPENVAYRCVVDLKKLLKEKGLTQVTCADNAGISVTTISNICHGKNTSMKTAAAISRVLDYPISSLFAPTQPQRKLASHTVRHYHRLLSCILGDAVKWQYIPYNPCGRVAPPRAESSDIEYLDDRQAKELMALLQKEPSIYCRAISLLLLTGLRRGELLGLEWQDIDFNAKTMHIVRTSQYLPSRGIFTETPKTKSSKRLVIISDQVLDILRGQLLWQHLQAKRLPDRWMDSGRVITSEDGSPMHPDRLTRWFGKFIRRTDLPQIHVHSLRHTYATLCIANGVPITAVAAQLGHANVAITATIYAHAIRTAQIAAADKVGGLFANVIKCD